MDWHRGYSCRYSLTMLNADWTDGMQVGQVRSCTIERSCTDSVPLLESATVELDADSPDDVPEGWMRVDAIASQGGETVREMLGCFRFEVSSMTEAPGSVQARLSGSSVLKPASEATIPAGSYAPKGADGASWAASMLSACPTAVSASGSFAIPGNVVFGDGETQLSAAWAVLDAAGWCIRLSGDGSISIVPRPSEPSHTFSAASPAGIQHGVTLGNEVSYVREYVPGIVPFDVVEASLPSAFLQGRYWVARQSLSLGRGITVKETVRGA